MDTDTMRLLFDIAQFAMTGAIGFYVYLSNKNRVTNERITKIEEHVYGRLNSTESRLAGLDERIEHLPSKDNMIDLIAKVERIGGDVRVVKQQCESLDQRIKPIQHQLELVNEYLLNRKP